MIDLDDIELNIGCVIMASGCGRRFGSNKLLVKFQDKTLYQRTFDITEGIFQKRVVVTRTQEVYESAKEQGIDTIFHELPNRNDVVRLGIERMKDMDACVFCPCDQPLLTRDSVQCLVNAFRLEKRKIIRLAWNERPGTPILFDKSCFEELCKLPEKKGGAYLAVKYTDKVAYVQVREEKELMDVDTREQMEELLHL